MRGCARVVPGPAGNRGARGGRSTWSGYSTPTRRQRHPRSRARCRSRKLDVRSSKIRSVPPSAQPANRPRPVDVPAPAEPGAIARATLDGFNRHYALFRDCAHIAKRHFEAGNWLAIAHTSQDRIDFYDRRVAETVAKLEREFGCGDRIDEARWEAVKRHYIALLIDHKQPECAETFFNSVSCKILHRTYFHNRCLFVRPAVSTEHIDADPPSYRSYYPRPARPAARADRHGPRLPARAPASRDFRRDLAQPARRVPRAVPAPVRLEANHQIQVLSSPVLPQPHGLHRRARHQRLHDAPVRRADQARRRRQALRGRAAAGSRADRAAVLGQPRLLPGRHGGAVGVRRVPARNGAGRAPRPSSTRWSACRSRARRCSSATSCTTSGTRPTVSSSRPASRAW